MKKQQTIQILKYLNEWRRGGEGEQPDPKTIGIAIDSAISILSSRGSGNGGKYYYKNKYEETIGFNDSAINELQFEKLQVDSLYNALDEISVMTTDPLTKKVCEITKERHQTDKLIHTRNLFDK